MSDAAWEKLDQIAGAFRGDGVHVTAGQVGAQLLHDAIARVGAGVSCPTAPDGGPRLVAAAETIEVAASRGARGVESTRPGLVDLPGVTVELRTTATRAATSSAAPALGPGRGTQWIVQAIVLHATKAP